MSINKITSSTLFLLCSLVYGGAPAIAAPPATPVLLVTPIDLSNATDRSKVLQFDTWLQLSQSIKKTESVEGVFARECENGFCDETVPSDNKGNDIVPPSKGFCFNAETKQYTMKDNTKWCNLVKSVSDVGADSASVSVAVPPLLANRTYQFHFVTKQPAADSSKVRSAVSKAIVRHMESITNPSSAGNESGDPDLSAFCAELNSEITKTLASGEVFDGSQYLGDCKRGKYNTELKNTYKALATSKYRANSSAGRAKSILAAGAVDDLVVGSISEMQKEDYIRDFSARAASLPITSRSQLRFGKAITLLSASAPTRKRLAHCGAIAGSDDLLNSKLQSVGDIDAIMINCEYISESMAQLRSLSKGGISIVSEEVKKSNSDVVSAEIGQAKALISSIPAETFDSALEAVGNASNSLDQARANLLLYEDAAQKYQAQLDQYQVEVLKSYTFQQANISTYDTRKSSFITTDGGIAWAFSINEVLPYFGLNIYLDSVNRDVPLDVLKRTGVCDYCFLKRFSFTVGATLASYSDSKRFKGAFGSTSVLLGAGFRLTDYIRANGGGIIYRKADDNPLVDQADSSVTPYFGLSFDWDIANSFKGFGSAFQ